MTDDAKTKTFPKPMLRISVDVIPEFGSIDEALIYTDRRVFPIEAAMDLSYHTYLTTETLNMLTKIRRAIQETQ